MRPPVRAPLAGGLPISAATADAAAEWLTLLMSDEADDDARRRWRAWRDADPEHERAWRHIEAVAARFKGLHGGAAYQTLSPQAEAEAEAGAPARRKGLRTLLWLGVAVGAGLFGARAPAVRYALAEHRSGVGERRELVLADGSRVTLNTNSAVNVDFDGRRRLLRLVEGEVMIVTGHAGAAAAAPFIVETAEGTVRALGTRFSVRQRDGSTEVAVFDSAVAVAPSARAGAALRLSAGQRIAFSRAELGAQSATDEHSAAWLRGQVLADNVRLDDFLADIARYRRGVLRCEPDVAGLRISGVFPLSDTDRVLDMLASSLPVRVRSRTAYWVTVEAAP
ncbi:FecR domain-containing protein [Janthinobacterium fluminis]|uniref:FecR domain-containing protein n=1 Tax=Janthinobacterium fluminis TaxID=2987524 RepID=A0ABT5K1V9_9BURK|nr:FecR domain-containing protein [Janthinobacterium fluminis]MDC8758706.1 FecR domain-containing protein [Janthinobacterium fluminis]